MRWASVEEKRTRKGCRFCVCAYNERSTPPKSVQGESHRDIVGIASTNNESFPKLCFNLGADSWSSFRKSMSPIYRSLEDGWQPNTLVSKLNKRLRQPSSMFTTGSELSFSATIKKCINEVLFQNFLHLHRILARSMKTLQHIAGAAPS